MMSRTSINTDLLSTPEFLMAPPTQFGQSIPPLELPAKHNAGFKTSPAPTFKSHISDNTLRAAAAAAKVAQRTSFASGLDFGASWPDALASAKAQPRGGLRIKAPQNDVFMRPAPTSPMSCSSIDSLEDLVPTTKPRQSSTDDDDSAPGSDSASTLESKEAPIILKTESPTPPAPVQPPPLPARRNLRPRKPRNQALIDELKEGPVIEVEEGDNVCCICVNTLVKTDTFPVPVPFKLAAGAKPYLHSPKLCNTHYNFVRRHFAIDQAKAHKKCQKVPHARCLHVLQGLAATGLQLYKPGTEPPATCSTPKRRAPRSSSSSSLGRTTSSSGAPSGGMSPKVEGSQVAGFKQAASKVPRKRARSKGSNILDPTCSPLDAKPCTECPSPRVAKQWLHCELVTDDDINKAVDQLDMAVGLCDLGFDDEVFGVGSACLGHHSGSDTKRRRFQS